MLLMELHITTKVESYNPEMIELSEKSHGLKSLQDFEAYRIEVSYLSTYS